ncbi:MAG: hypothetical protein ACJAS6_001073 [Rickettsiales bacterium]|jgi:hypothetical protein
MNNFSDNIKAKLFSFKKHPLAFYFLLSFITINWEAILYMFSELEIDKKIPAIKSKLHKITSIDFSFTPTFIADMLSTLNHLALPFFVASFIVFIFNPKIAKAFYEKHIKTDFQFKNLRRGIEDNECLTNEESLSIKIENLRQEEKYLNISNQNSSLKTLLDSEKESKRIMVESLRSQINNEKETKKREIESLKAQLSRDKLSSEKELQNKFDKELSKKDLDMKKLTIDLNQLEACKEELENAKEQNDSNRNNISYTTSMLKKYDFDSKIKQEFFYDDFIKFVDKLKILGGGDYEVNYYEKQKIIESYEEKIEVFDQKGLFDKRNNNIKFLGKLVYNTSEGNTKFA